MRLDLARTNFASWGCMDCPTRVETGTGAPDIPSAEDALRLLPAGVLVAKAPAGEIVYINDYGRRLAGGNVVGRRLRGTCLVQRIDGASLGPNERPLARAFSGETLGPEELRLQRCHTGQWLTVRVSAAPIHDSAGTHIAGAVLCFQEIASRHKDEFLAMLAQELASPLNALGNGLEVVARAPEDPAVLQSARAMMARQVGQIGRLVDDLRDLANIRSGTLPLERKRLDLGELAHAALERAMPLLQARHHRLDLALPDAPVWIQGDPVRLVQVLASLLSNAARYTLRPGIVSLSVEAREGFAVLQVADTGVGIAPGDLESIFELSRKAGDSERRRAGLSLGLHLARWLVELHGGSIRAESAGLQAGSRFTVRLPLAGD